MRSGLRRILNYAHGATKLSKGLKDAISWHACVAKASAICAVSLGSQITKIISNAIFIKRKMMMKLADRKQCLKNLTSLLKSISIQMDWCYH
jgi:hypothetical protein